MLYLALKLQYINKEQFNLRAHIDRLYSGCKILRIMLEMTPDEMEKACYQTIKQMTIYLKQMMNTDL